MDTLKILNRRKFFQSGAIVLSGMITSKTLAQMCKLNTGEQALGPFFPKTGTPVDPIKESNDPTLPIFLANDNDLTFIKGRAGVASGQKVVVQGVLSDDQCRPIANATIIIWQASESGRYNHKGDSDNADFKDPRDGKIIKRTLDPYFQSWGTTTTNEKGEYEFKTIVPGYYPADVDSGWYRPPHIHFLVSATGFTQFVTQMYFRSSFIKDNNWIQELNEKDLLLQGDNLTEQQRQQLIVDFKMSPESIEMQGEFNMTLKK